MKRYAPRRAERGLTWVGVAIVLLLGALFVFVGYLAVVNQSCGGGKIKTTQLKLGGVKSAVQQYYATVGVYPTQWEGFIPLLHPPDGLKPMLETLPRDEWGNLLLYFSPPIAGDAPFELRSAGADGVWFTDDDLSSIRREDRYPDRE